MVDPVQPDHQLSLVKGLSVKLHTAVLLCTVWPHLSLIYSVSPHSCLGVSFCCSSLRFVHYSVSPHSSLGCESLL